MCLVGQAEIFPPDLSRWVGLSIWGREREGHAWRRMDRSGDERFGGSKRLVKTERKNKTKWRRNAELFILTCTLIATAFSMEWSFQAGDTLVECSGASYRPPYTVGPYDDWSIINECGGPCDGFDSMRMIGFVAGKWQFYLAVMQGWRPGGLNPPPPQPALEPTAG